MDHEAQAGTYLQSALIYFCVKVCMYVCACVRTYIHTYFDNGATMYDSFYIYFLIALDVDKALRSSSIFLIACMGIGLGVAIVVIIIIALICPVSTKQ